MMNRKHYLSLAVTLTLLAPSITYAAEAEESVTELSEVVVTAAGYELKERYAPASITVITAEDIERHGYTDFRQILSSVEGVDTFGATGRFDTPAISIRGLDDSYTLMMVDGVSLNGPGIAGGMMRSFNQIANASLPPASTIERIEVVRGPMSTLYGSDAMGGVVNIITKKVPKETVATLSIGHLFETDSDKRNMQKYDFTVGGAIQEDKIGFQFRGSYLHRGSSIYGVETHARDYDNWSAGTRFTWTPTEDASYYLDYDRGRQTRDGGFGMQIDAPLGLLDASGAVEQQFDRTKFVFHAENKLGKGQWTNTLSYIQNKMQLDADLTADVPLFAAQVYPEIRNRVKNDIFTYDTKYVTELGDCHKLVVGGRYWHEKVDYSLRRTPRSNNPFLSMMAPSLMGADDHGKKSRDMWALYAEDTWDISDKLGFTYGLRYNHPEDFDDNISPRGYLVYAADDYITVKGGVATGYKAPSLLQAAPTDLYLTINSGLERYRGNPNLKPEKSRTEEVGVYYSNPHGTNAHITYFHTDFKNKIELGDTDFDMVNMYSFRQYENVGRARVQGVELGTGFDVADKVKASLNYTFMTSRIKSGEDYGKPLRSTPKHAVNLKFDWNPTTDTNVWLSANYRNGIYRTTQVDGLDSYYRPFTVVNTGITHKLSEQLKVHFNIYNLLDKDFDKGRTVGGTRYSSFYDEVDANGDAGGTYISGRSFWLGLNYTF